MPVNGGGTDNPVTTISYSDTPGNLYTEIQRKIDSSTWTDEYTLYDGLGRAVSHSRVDPDNGWDRSDTGYDGEGRVAFQSYPCAASTPTGAAVCTAGDTFSYDALGRTLTVTHSDQSQISYTYQGAATEVADEGNGSTRVTHVYQHDGLGRLTSVYEADGETGAGTNSTPTSCSNQIAGFPQDMSLTSFETGYSYDALGDLTNVQQPGLADRTFSYDSLGRLLNGTNPEAGTTSYSYDADGNVLTRTRPAPNQADPGVTVTTSYSYDALERLRTVSYSDGTTPGLSYAYDQSQNWTQTLTNSIGRRTAAYVDGSGLGTPPVNFVIGRIWSYDAMGRVVSSSVCRPSICGVGAWTATMAYDLVGERTGRTTGLGSGYTAQWNRAGRLVSLSGTRNDAAHPPQLLSGAIWFANGGLRQAERANGVEETRGQDGRGRLLALQDGATYGLSRTLAPDGVVQAESDSINGTWSYGYDALNRLTGAGCSASCLGGGSPALTLGWSYDRYGNRWAQTVTAGTAPAPSASFSGGDNRPDPGTAPYTYDAAGNLLGDGAHTYAWDAENRLVGVDGGAVRYRYDTRGERAETVAAGVVTDRVAGPGANVLLLNGSGQLEREEIWAAGERVATYTTAAQPGGSDNTIVSYADARGTVHLQLPVAAAPVITCSNLPFGDNLSCTGNPDSLPSPLHFTGKPRDAETGLDNFGARLYSSSLGRWMTPDWSAQAEPVPYAKFTDPQSLNLYTYSDNAPVSKTDANGHFPLLGLVGIGVAVGEVATHGAELYYKSQDDAALIRWEQADGKMLNDALYSPSSKVDTDNLIKEINQLRAELGWALLDTGQTLEQVLEPIPKAPTATVTQSGATVEKDIGVIIDTSTKASVSVTQKIGLPGKEGNSQTQRTGQLPSPQPQPKRCDKPGGQDCK